MPFYHQATSVSPNLNKISAGLNFKPSDNSTGSLFGHGFFRTNSSRGMVRTRSKSCVGEGVGVGVAQGATLFLRFSQIFGLLPLNILTIVPNETTASLNIPQTRMQSAFENDKRVPFQKPPHSKREFRTLKERFNPPTRAMGLFFLMLYGRLKEKKGKRPLGSCPVSLVITSPQHIFPSLLNGFVRWELALPVFLQPILYSGWITAGFTVSFINSATCV